MFQGLSLISIIRVMILLWFTALVVGTDMVPETLVAFNELTWMLLLNNAGHMAHMGKMTNAYTFYRFVWPSV
jgi:hypothetical protein